MSSVPGGSTGRPPTAWPRSSSSRSFPAPLSAAYVTLSLLAHNPVPTMFDYVTRSLLGECALLYLFVALAFGAILYVASKE
jgi:hypothetical protein